MARQIGRVENGLVEFEHPPGEKDVIVEKTVDGRLAVAQAVEQAAVWQSSRSARASAAVFARKASSSSSKARAALARAANIRPLLSVRTMSSQRGRTRFSRAASNFWRQISRPLPRQGVHGKTGPGGVGQGTGQMEDVAARRLARGLIVGVARLGCAHGLRKSGASSPSRPRSSFALQT